MLNHTHTHTYIHIVQRHTIMHILIDYKYYAHIIQSGKRKSTLYLGRAMGTELIPKPSLSHIAHAAMVSDCSPCVKHIGRESLKITRSELCRHIVCITNRTRAKQSLGPTSRRSTRGWRQVRVSFDNLSSELNSHMSLSAIIRP